MNARTKILAVGVIAAMASAAWWLMHRNAGEGSASDHSDHAASTSASEPKVLYWYDPMKPEVHFDHPGKSPFMDMQLEPKYAEEPTASGAAAPPGLSVVRIPLERRQEIGVTTAKVEKRTIGGSIETNGVVAEDEGRLNAV